MIEITLDEFVLILARFLLGLGKIVTADDKLGQRHVRRLCAAIFSVQGANALDPRQSHLSGPVREHHDIRAQLHR